MVKIRFHGEPEEIKAFADWFERNPCVEVLSRSDGYPDRGKSVYERVYMDVKLRLPATINKDFEAVFKSDNK